MNKSVDNIIGDAETLDELFASLPKREKQAEETPRCRTLFIYACNIQEILSDVLRCLTDIGIPIRSFSVAETEREDHGWFAIRTAECEAWKIRFGIEHILGTRHVIHAGEVCHVSENDKNVHRDHYDFDAHAIQVRQHMRAEVDCDDGQMEEVRALFEGEEGGRIEREFCSTITAALTAYPDIVDGVMHRLSILSRRVRSRVNAPILNPFDYIRAYGEEGIARSDKKHDHLLVESGRRYIVVLGKHDRSALDVAGNILTTLRSHDITVANVSNTEIDGRSDRFRLTLSIDRSTDKQAEQVCDLLKKRSAVMVACPIAGEHANQHAILEAGNVPFPNKVTELIKEMSGKVTYRLGNNFVVKMTDTPHGLAQKMQDLQSEVSDLCYARYAPVARMAEGRGGF